MPSDLGARPSGGSDLPKRVKGPEPAQGSGPFCFPLTAHTIAMPWIMGYGGYSRTGDAGPRSPQEEIMSDQITCKCGARTYEQHLASNKSAHTYKPDKASGQVRK